jgi:hypothetical protein
MYKLLFLLRFIVHHIRKHPYSQIKPRQYSHWISCYKFWSKFQFESYLNFEGVQTFGKNMVNSLKFFLDMIFHNVNLVCFTCIQKFEVHLQVVNMTWFK